MCNGNGYDNEAKERWGGTAAYAEFMEKAKSYLPDNDADASVGLDRIIAEFSACMMSSAQPGSPEALALVEKLRKYITDNFYTCTDDILSCLGRMYSGDERFRENIDSHGAGTADFMSKAIFFAVG